MTVSNMVIASLMGVMLLSGAVAKRDLTQQSRACERFPHLPQCRGEAPPPVPTDDVGLPTCPATSWGYSEATNEDQSAVAAADAQAFICGGDGSAKSAYEIAQATAIAFAEAVADASVNGEAHSIYGDCWGEAGSNAGTKAQLWLESYIGAFATFVDCQHCEAWAESWTYIREEVFLKAVAGASPTLDLYGDDTETRVGHLQSYGEEIAEAIVTAYAEALAGAANYYDANSCVVFVDCPSPGACSTRCTASAVSDTFIEEIDGIATAVAEASADSCGSVLLSFELTNAWARAIAEALAHATAHNYVSCQADDGSYACADASAHSTDTAKAVAKAFVTAWADAITCGPDCYMNIDDASEDIGHVLATASASAYSAVCADSESTWTVENFQQHIEDEHLVAIAEACALALALDTGSGGFCLAAVTADTYLH